jgi:hypothetical protein
VHGYRTINQSIRHRPSSSIPIGGSNCLLAILSKKHISFANFISGASLMMPFMGRLLGGVACLRAIGRPTGHEV